MSEYVRKIMPYQSYETDALEGWLEEMAQDGLMLQRATMFIAKFKKELPSNTRFRVDSNQEKNREKNKARREEIKELGWEFVTHYRGAIYKTTNTNLMEPPPISPDVERSNILQKTKRIYVFLLFFIFKIFDTAAKMINDSYVYPTIQWLKIAEGEIHTIIACSIFIITSFGASLFIFVSAMKVRQRIKRGEYPDRSFHNQNRVKRRTITIIIFIALFLSIIPNMVLSSPSTQEISLRNYNDSFSFPLLEKINAEEWDQLLSATQTQDYLYNYMMKKSTILAPSILMARQNSPNDIGDFSYNVNYYQLFNNYLAEKISSEMLEQHTYQKINTNTDVNIMFASNDNVQHLVLSHENIVIEVRYEGATDLRNCISLYENYLLQANTKTARILNSTSQS